MIPSKNLPRGTALAHKEYNKYLQLIHISGNDLSFMLFMLKAQGKSDGRQVSLTQPTLQTQSDRINMGTQDPKNQNL